MSHRSFPLDPSPGRFFVMDDISCAMASFAAAAFLAE